MLEVNNFFHGTRIVEGYGVLNETGNEVKALGFKKVLIVTDDFLSKSAHYQVLKESLEKEGIKYLLETKFLKDVEITYLWPLKITHIKDYTLTGKKF